MKERNLIVFVIVILFLLTTQTALPYDADFHPLITREAIDESKLAQTDYLKTELEFQDGLNEKFTGPAHTLSHPLTVREWIEMGSQWEDRFRIYYPLGPFRAPRHLYDPVHPPGRMTDMNETVKQRCGWPWPSALEWATARLDEHDPFSWTDARNYYYLALTSESKEDRELNFAMAFRALGQVIHLLEDIAVPAHVRNDNHADIPILAPFSKDMYEHYWKPNKGIPSSSYPVVDLPKFSDYFDTTVDSAVFGEGLAEFTNHNFVSRDTNFNPEKPYHQYDYPENINTWHPENIEVTYYDPVLEILITEMVEVDYMIAPVIDNYLGPTFTNNYLTARSAWDFELNRLFGIKVYSLNDYCHAAYGEFLLPRAVGYSAGLLNYFFRGELGVEVGVDVAGDIELTITNESAETINGTLELYWDDENGVRSPVSGASWSVNLGPGDELSPKPTFTPPCSAVGYMLVFGKDAGENFGTIGEEEGIIGKTFIILPFAWWKFDENESIIAYDSGSGGNDGTIHGASWTTGKIGSALSFDGTDDYVDVSTVVSGWGEGTISVWVNYVNPTAGPNGDYIFSATTGGPGYSAPDKLNLGIHPVYETDLRFGIYAGGWQWAASGITPTAGQWYHVAGTWGSTGIKIYVNGVLKETNNYTDGSPSTNYNIIGASSWPHSFVSGKIDDVRIYDYILTPGEILCIYNQSQ